MTVIKQETVKEYSPGDNLGHPNLQVIKASTAEELKEILIRMTHPYNILFIYGSNNRHYAWIETRKKTKKVRRK